MGEPSEPTRPSAWPGVLDADDPPVTYSVSWRVKPGCEEVFEGILNEMVHAAMAFPGHLGVTVFAPAKAADPVFHVIVRFDAVSSLDRWTVSDERHRWLSEAKQYEAAPPMLKTVTGLESWFTAPGQSVVLAPSRIKMCIVTAIAVFPTITVIRALIGPIVYTWPMPLQTLATVILMTPAMTYFVMPRLTKLIQGWLYPKTDPDRLLSRPIPKYHQRTI